MITFADKKRIKNELIKAIVDGLPLKTVDPRIVELRHYPGNPYLKVVMNDPDMNGPVYFLLSIKEQM